MTRCEIEWCGSVKNHLEDGANVAQLSQSGEGSAEVPSSKIGGLLRVVYGVQK
ncbi:MAG: hypothetical protein LBJ94_03715 [Puniceicoccales bacterium]|jgi:hypothetical protein|nr:hypothetical protein [Puniceicoccales bacterium]